MHFSSTLSAAAILALANGAALRSRANSGEATFYGGNVDGGMCSFSGYTIPSGLYGLALTDSSWDGAKACGACIEVTGPKGNTITAMVVDQCPGCGTNHLDLFPDAFAKLDDPSKGVIQTTWNIVNCPISSPIQVRNKEGVSQYWFSMQVINANKRVESLEFSTDGGSTWKSTERQPYNYFEYSSGSGTTTVDVKITSVEGDVVIVKGVGISSGKSATAASNFGSSSGATKSTTVKAEPVPTSTTTLAASVAQSKPTTAAAAASPTTTTPGAIFQETSSYIPKPSTSATSVTTSLATSPAVIYSSPVAAPTTTSSSSILPTTSHTAVEAPEAVVTVIVNACAAS